MHQASAHLQRNGGHSQHCWSLNFELSCRILGAPGIMANENITELLDLALSAAREAGDITLQYFKRDLAVQIKADGSPVTIADRNSEEYLRDRIESRFPDHTILGEEFGESRPGAVYRWLLDPIDGTLSFVRGVGLYGVMIGVERAGEPILGVVHFPALGETVWAARGHGSWWNGERCQVSKVASLKDAMFLYTDSRLFESAGHPETLHSLRAHTRLERTWGDCYGHMLVATGRADVMVDPLLNEWDACPLLVILEEAGGRFFDWQGRRSVRGGSGISTNGLLCEEVVRILAGNEVDAKS
jgi:histidinol phosphatase-like enzyme (inositol monophosphatase family)